MHTKQEIYHLARVAERLESDGVKEAFLLMVTTLYRGKGYRLRPASQGAFSVLQIRISEKNCFAFKGAKSHLRFYFRKPCFDAGYCDEHVIFERFPKAEKVQGFEVALNVETFDDANDLLVFLKRSCFSLLT